MGNNCCASDSKDETSAFTFNKAEKNKLLSNMNMINKDASLFEHAPKSLVASVTESMNPMSDEVMKVHSKEANPIINKQELQSRFENCPYLGPYKFQDKATYEG
jgi:TRAP-type mannitol/chloroaromatic compound transport system substrate-binding protein